MANDQDDKKKNEQTPPVGASTATTPSPEELARQKQADADRQAAIDANKARDAAAAVAKPGATLLVVCPGMSITTKRGVIDAGEPVTALDFHNGEVDLNSLVDRGVVIKKRA